MEPGDTAVATPAGESALDTDETTEEPDLEIAATEQIECLPLSQPTIPSDPPQN